MTYALGGRISNCLLAQAIAGLNSRIRQSKLSAIEVWTSREMTSGNPLSIDDKKLIQEKYQQRQSHHAASAKYKARGKTEVQSPEVNVGDVVYLYSDRSKLKSRDKYLIVELNNDEKEIVGNLDAPNKDTNTVAEV